MRLRMTSARVLAGLAVAVVLPASAATSEHQPKTIHPKHVSGSSHAVGLPIQIAHGKQRTPGGQEAPNLVAGLRISNLTTDPVTLNASFDVTEMMDSLYPFTTAWLGVGTFYGLQFYPAITFGDGSTVPFNNFYNYTGIPLVGTNTYSTRDGGSRHVQLFRGSFSHTYPNAGPWTVTVESVCCETGTSLSGIVTGNWHPFSLYIPTYQTVTTGTNLTANALVSFGSGAPAEAIPTASRTGLLLLGAVLAGAGVWVLRRK